MFNEFFRKRRAAKEAAELGQIQARDANAGVPTQETLKKRFGKAARQGKWSIVDDCVQKGCSYADGVPVKNMRFEGEEYFRPFKKVVGSESYYYNELPLASIAAMLKDTQGLELLLSRGAPANWPAGTNYTDGDLHPLMLAVRYDLPAAVKLLCDNGVDLSNTAALREAESENNLEIVKIIRAEEAKRNGAQQPGAPDATQGVQDRVIRELNTLSPEARGKVLWKLREEFEGAKAPAAATKDDLQVLKPISLKTSAKAVPG